jgi:hypothetical protein
MFPKRSAVQEVHVSFKLIRRSVSVAASAVLLFTLLAPSAVLANTPSWVMSFSSAIPVASNVTPSSGTTPASETVAVTPGSFFQTTVVITNNGKSNISKLYLEDNSGAGSAPPPITSSVLKDAHTDQGSCTTSDPLFCNFGSLAKNQAVHVTLVYQTPSDSSDPNATVWLYANTSGVSYTDGGSSHGDVLAGSVIVSPVSTPGAAAGYAFDLSAISTSGGNQQTTINPPTTGIGLAIQQTEFSGTTPCGTTAFGQDVATNVGNGGTFSAFKTTLTYDTSLLNPETELSNISVCHTYDRPLTNPAKITTACSFDSSGAPTNAPCINARFEGPTGSTSDDYPTLVCTSWFNCHWVPAAQDADDFMTLVIDVWDTQNGHSLGGV